MREVPESRPRPSLWVAVIILHLALASVLAGSLLAGPGDVTGGEALDALRWGVAVPSPPPAGTDGRGATVFALVWQLRLPRALLTMVVGAALGMAGALTQGLFRNPLAEPGVLGVGSGAATLAVLGFVLGLDLWGMWTIPLLAACGAAGVLAILLVVSAAGTRSTTLLLSGVAIGAFTAAVTTVLLAVFGERWDLGLKIVHWLMGTFESRGWPHLLVTFPALVIGGAVALVVRRDLDALLLGDDTASSLGVDLRATRLISLGAVALLVGAATAVSGVIGFVGLIVPHAVRLAAGPAHGRLVPLSALAGALLLAVVDLTVRSLPGAPLPPGVITSFLGAPFFVWLLVRDRGERSAPGEASKGRGA